jgi:CRP-like cAMP-binding protein
LIEADERVEHVYLPGSGIASKLTVLSDGCSVESTTIGRDGLIGLSAYLGSEISTSRFIVHVPGEALRITSQRLRAIAENNKSFTPCSITTPQRCARWLLRVHDLVNGNEFPLTQESLAQMLGVRRASVSIAAGEMQDAGLIRYAYGHVTILDQSRLETVSCECVAVVRRRYQSILLNATI